jgi:hypothetical protein
MNGEMKERGKIQEDFGRHVWVVVRDKFWREEFVGNGLGSELNCGNRSGINYSSYRRMRGSEG